MTNGAGTGQPPPPGRQAPRISRTRYVAYVGIIVFSGILMYLLTARELRNFLVPTNSMLPTFQSADYIFTMNAPAYERGDVVVLDDPLEPGAYVVKRIVALGGDSVSIRWGALYRNGEYVSEPYTLEPMIYDFPPPRAGASYTVPAGEVFVLGDNRNHSDDSSNWGVEYQLSHSVPTESIVGRVHGIYLPPSRMQRIEGFPALTVPMR